MNADIKAKWVAALRSGEYEQGAGALRSSSDRFCCLGVLCDLHAKETGTEWDDCNYLAYTTDLPPDVRAWVGGFDPMTKLTIEGRKELPEMHNDGGRTFAQIAGAIEEQL